MGEGSLIADFIACIAMLDPILGRDRPVTDSAAGSVPRRAGTRPVDDLDCGRTRRWFPIPAQVDVPEELRT